MKLTTAQQGEIERRRETSSEIIGQSVFVAVVASVCWIVIQLHRHPEDSPIRLGVGALFMFSYVLFMRMALLAVRQLQRDEKVRRNRGEF